MANWFYYDINGVKQGPFTSVQLKSLVGTGVITPNTVIETEQGKQTNAQKIQGLTFVKQAVIPSVPVPPPITLVSSAEPEYGVHRNFSGPDKSAGVAEEITEYIGYPDWIRGNPFLMAFSIFLIIVALILFIAGLITSNEDSIILILVGCFALGIAGLFVFQCWFSSLCTKLTITNNRSILRRGFFSRHESELFHEDIRGVSVSQDFLQRLFKTGNLSVSSAASGSAEIIAGGFYEPDKIKSIIQKHRKK